MYWPMNRVNVVADFVIENLTNYKVAKHWGSVQPANSRFHNIVHVKPNRRRR